MKLRGKPMAWVLGAAVGILYLLTICVLTHWQARNIQSTMLAELETQFRGGLSQVQAAAKASDETEEKLYAAYQKAMSDNSELDDASYMYRSASLLRTQTGEVVVQSRNVLLCTFYGSDGTEEIVPMAFTHENSADVGEMLWSYMLSDGDKISGYWEGDLFYVTDYQSKIRSFFYTSPEESSQEKTTVDLDISTSWAQIIEEVPLAKNFGGTSYWGTDYMRGWKKTDQLLERLQSDVVLDWTRILAPQFSAVQKGLFYTRVVGTCVFMDYNGVFERPRSLQYVYGAEFSPVKLALGDIYGSSLGVLLTLGFLLAGFALIQLYLESRKRELRQYQDELTRQAQALEYAKNAEESRRSMTSAIAHELKTPIAVLSSYAEALQENIDAEKQAHYLSVIREETGKMDQMVLELLDLSRLEAGKYKLRREDFNLTELVREILEPLMPQIQEKSITLSWQIGQEQVNGDRYRFGQVVENYMTNAIRHTPEGGKIVLRIGMNHETFSVENQGRQIPDEQLKRVWETFWQGDQSRNNRGSGLGLSICRSIMSLHGGSCKAENTSIGVRFTANLEPEGRMPLFYSMPKEENVVLQYSIAQEYTTVESVMHRLGLLDKTALQREIRAGTLKRGSETVLSPKERLYPGYVLSWQDVKIAITLDDREKRRMLLMERMRRNGGLGNPENVCSMGGGMKR
jgi:signal transduction histidine kinase